MGAGTSRFAGRLLAGHPRHGIDAQLRIASQGVEGEMVLVVQALRRRAFGAVRDEPPGGQADGRQVVGASGAVRADSPDIRGLGGGRERGAEVRQGTRIPDRPSCRPGGIQATERIGFLPPSRRTRPPGTATRWCPRHNARWPASVPLARRSRMALATRLRRLTASRGQARRWPTPRWRGRGRRRPGRRSRVRASPGRSR